MLVEDQRMRPVMYLLFVVKVKVPLAIIMISFQFGYRAKDD